MTVVMLINLIKIKSQIMDKSRSQVNHKNMKVDNNANKPVNKDTLDSREREEQQLKGEDKVTHNKKERRSEGKKSK